MPLHNDDELREAALWVVMNWDAERSQHNSMPMLRKALGLPSERPTREEAQARINGYIGISRLPKDLIGVLRDPSIVIERDHEIRLADGRSLAEHMHDWTRSENE